MYLCVSQAVISVVFPLLMVKSQNIKQKVASFSFVCQARLLDTIGTTRGFGDHDLKVAFCSLPIKPFLTPQPEVRFSSGVL